jgi:cytochrome c
VIVVALVVLGACGTDAGRPESAEAGSYGLGVAPDSARLATWDRDVAATGAELPPGRGSVAEGRVLYAAQCAACHGANGEGIAPAFPQLVGRPAAGEGFDFASDLSIPRTIGNYWPHATTLFDYIRRTMPLLTPGTLTDDQTYALTAYLLAANAVIPDTATLDADVLRAVQMPARDRFVADDRTGGRGVR